MREVIKSLIPDTVLTMYRKITRKTRFIDQIEEHEGDNVLCPICNFSYKIFETRGRIPRINAKCHNCGSLERHRLIWKYLSDELDLFNSDAPIRLLHFAPEKMFFDMFSKMTNVQYHPCDLMPEKYDYTGDVEVIKVDITKNPFDDNSFDLILCNHVLEHIPEDILAMKELYRVMKKGGHGIFQVPIDYSLTETYEDFSITSPEAREKAFGQHDHVRWYGKDYKIRLENAGFEVDENSYVKGFSKEDIFKYGLNLNELIYHCTK